MKSFKGTETDLIVEPDADLSDLIPNFIDYRKNDVAQSKEAIDKNDFEFLKRLGHTIKGVARPYGFNYLETIARNLEDSAVEENIDACRDSISEMEYYISNVVIKV